jgi:hypothetical protein
MVFMCSLLWLLVRLLGVFGFLATLLLGVFGFLATLLHFGSWLLVTTATRRLLLVLPFPSGPRRWATTGLSGFVPCVTISVCSLSLCCNSTLLLALPCARLVPAAGPTGLSRRLSSVSCCAASMAAAAVLAAARNVTPPCWSRTCSLPLDAKNLRLTV